MTAILDKIYEDNFCHDFNNQNLKLAFILKKIHPDVHFDKFVSQYPPDSKVTFLIFEIIKSSISPFAV